MSNTTLTDLTGARLGEYLVTARLGTGGMGVVYEGVQPVIGKKVAVKVLLQHLMADPTLVERFLAEARAVNAIGHRGIVDIFGFGELPSGALYFVMELLEGVPFDALIKREGALEPSRVLDYLEEILDALDAVHAVGITHRDIKPSNIFLVVPQRGRPYVKLLDFGIAKLGGQTSGEVTRVNTVLGTPNYMAPEQVLSEAVGPATDLYSLGCVLFELLTGERPFPGGTAVTTMMMHVKEPPRRPSSVRRGVPPELDALVGWMLEKDARARPPSAHALLEHVERLRNTASTQPLSWSTSPAAERQTTQELRPLGAAGDEGTTLMRPARAPAVEGEAGILTLVRPAPAPKAPAVEREASIPTVVRPAPTQGEARGRAEARPTELSRAAPPAEPGPAASVEASPSGPITDPWRPAPSPAEAPAPQASGKEPSRATPSQPPRSAASTEWQPTTDPLDARGDSTREPPLPVESQAPLPEVAVLSEPPMVLLEAARPVTLNSKLEVLEVVAQPELELGGGAGPVPNLELPQLEALTLPGERPPGAALGANPSAEAGPIPAPIASAARARGGTPAPPLGAVGPVPSEAAPQPPGSSASGGVPVAGVLVGMAVAAAAMAYGYSHWADAQAPEPRTALGAVANAQAPDAPAMAGPQATGNLQAALPSPFATPVLAVDAGRGLSRAPKPARLNAGELARKLEVLRTRLEARESKGPPLASLHVLLDEAERELLGAQSDEALGRAAKALGLLQRGLDGK